VISGGGDEEGLGLLEVLTNQCYRKEWKDEKEMGEYCQLKST